MQDSLTITWDVLKLVMIAEFMIMHVCLTITWDVLKSDGMPDEFIFSDGLTITWDVLKCYKVFRISKRL